MKQHKTAALLFHSLITSICLVSRVRTTTQNEHIMNKGVLTARTIKRITSESATTQPELVVVAWSRRIIGVERKLQELSDNITQCVKAQQRENNRF